MKRGGKYIIFAVAGLAYESTETTQLTQWIYLYPLFDTNCKICTEHKEVADAGSFNCHAPAADKNGQALKTAL